MSSMIYGPNSSGLCLCGCGEPAPVATRTSNKRGIKRGDFLPFIHGHHSRGLKRSPATLARMSAAHKGRKTGSEHARWKGGVRMHKGRRTLLVGKDHPMADSAGYALEHRLVMAAVLGRFLSSDEHVHHINRDPLDNRPENLIVLSASQHMRVHRFIDRRGMEPRAALDLVLEQI